MKPKLALSDNIISKMSEADRKEYGVLSLQERREKRDVRVEKELQKLVERWLHLQGYARRSPMDITYIKPKRGWQIHLHNAKRNPILLDVLLLANDGRWCEWELKTLDGKFSSKEQEILCTHHGKPVFQDLDSVIEYVTNWETNKKENDR